MERSEVLKKWVSVESKECWLVLVVFMEMVRMEQLWPNLFPWKGNSVEDLLSMPCGNVIWNELLLQIVLFQLMKHCILRQTDMSAFIIWITPKRDSIIIVKAVFVIITIIYLDQTWDINADWESSNCLCLAMCLWDSFAVPMFGMSKSL
jgi:hypothetical protein